MEKSWENIVKIVNCTVSVHRGKHGLKEFQKIYKAHLEVQEYIKVVFLTLDKSNKFKCMSSAIDIFLVTIKPLSSQPHNSTVDFSN